MVFLRLRIKGILQRTFRLEIRITLFASTSKLPLYSVGFLKIYIWERPFKDVDTEWSKTRPVVFFEMSSLMSYPGPDMQPQGP